MQTYILSISTKDQTGLIAAVTGSLFEQGANCGDTNFSVLGQGAELKCIFSLPKEINIEDIQHSLSSLNELKNADITIKPFSHSTEHHSSATITHNITIHGGDHQGLLAQLSEEFITFDANIVRLNSKQVSGSDGLQYHIEIAAYIPKNREQACLATINNTASNLQLECDVKTI